MTDGEDGTKAATAERSSRSAAASAHSALTELQQRRNFGPKSYELLLDVTSVVARAGGYPPPQGFVSWNHDDNDAVRDVAHDWLSSGQPRRTLQLLATVTDDASLARYLESAIRNHLNSVGRKTDRGAYRRAIRRLVLGDDRFAVMKEPWRYACQTTAAELPFSGDPQELVGAAAGVAVRPRPEWDSDRRAPIGHAGDVREVVLAILTEASCPVLEHPTVVDVVLERFNVAPRTTDRRLDPDMPAATLAPVDVVDEPEVVGVADGVWSQLGDEASRTVFAGIVAGEADRTIEARTGIAKSTVNRRRGRIQELLSEALEGVPFADQVIGNLAERSRSIQDGTSDAGSASTDDVEARHE